MEKLLLLTVMFTICNAESEALTGKLFRFPTGTGAYVKLLTSRTNFTNASVCLRFITDTEGEYPLFSLSTSEHHHAFTLNKIAGSVIRMQVQDNVTYFKSLALPPNTWHSLCAAWQSDNGSAQLWVNGIPTIKGYIQSGQPISGTPTTILGYYTYCAVSQPFIGAISEVHMWDYVLFASEVRRYVENVYFTPGNVFNWSSLEYELKGQAVVDKET